LPPIVSADVSAARSCFCCCKGQVLVAVNPFHAAPAVEGSAATYVHLQRFQYHLEMAAWQDVVATLSNVPRMAGNLTDLTTSTTTAKQ
jgi:hypothetical protein